MGARFLTLLALLALTLNSGCATYSLHSGDLRAGLAQRDYDGVLRSLDRSRKGPNRLLYLMERGLLEHDRGAPGPSNDLFDRAERLSDQLFTRSLSREMAAMVTNDAVRDYRGEAFELLFIHYYRALNYWQLGLSEDALVECRKANLKLARLSGGSKAYRDDAFLQYLTGLFYEATGEWNDAYVSYREARRLYRENAGASRIPTPPALDEDLGRVAARLGFEEEARGLLNGASPDLAGGEVILLCETGFVPRKVEKELNLPIFERDIEDRKDVDIDRLAREMALRPSRSTGWSPAFPGAEDAWRAFEGEAPARRTGGRFRPFHPRGEKVKYWLRVALPMYAEGGARTPPIRLTADDRRADGVPVEDLSAIARATFNQDYPRILVRTVARGLSKYLATEALDRKSKYLGFFANLFTASTEAADTRGWVSLPQTIQVARLRLPAGTHNLTVQALDEEGRVVDEKVMTGVTIHEGRRTFLRWRTYKG